MVKNDVTCRTAMYVEGAGGLPMPQLGVRVLPQEIFCNCKLWEGHFRENLKATGKKRLYTEIGKKKVFASKKRFKRFPRGAWISYTDKMSSLYWIGAQAATSLCVCQDTDRNPFVFIATLNGLIFCRHFKSISWAEHVCILTQKSLKIFWRV